MTQAFSLTMDSHTLDALDLSVTYLTRAVLTGEYELTEQQRLEVLLEMEQLDALIIQAKEGSTNANEKA